MQLERRRTDKHSAATTPAGTAVRGCRWKRNSARRSTETLSLGRNTGTAQRRCRRSSSRCVCRHWCTHVRAVRLCFGLRRPSSPLPLRTPAYQPRRSIMGSMLTVMRHATPRHHTVPPPSETWQSSAGSKARYTGLTARSCEPTMTAQSTSSTTMATWSATFRFVSGCWRHAPGASSLAGQCACCCGSDCVDLRQYLVTDEVRASSCAVDGSETLYRQAKQSHVTAIDCRSA